ncbi:MAG: hypothetical protein KGH61_01870 [Candidatus Micrarchaeota archaeon]|nr:hypothetical protein [Candidatus Micrarchaeota archaeon]MDE1847678.1 hypothetical protein [Candidatus Micrarchaeota archaeon]MDE1864499.1 hypothetical protein [Candidatus Micrarchaeota archaeon]
MPKKKEHHALDTLAALVIVVLIAVLVYVAYQALFSHPTQEQIIIVAGAVNTIGLGTTPTTISFTSDTGAYYSTVAYGKYAISLPGHKVYNVTISWKSIAGLTTGTCHAGNFSPPANSTLLPYNATC